MAYYDPKWQETRNKQAQTEPFSEVAIGNNRAQFESHLKFIQTRYPSSPGGSPAYDGPNQRIVYPLLRRPISEIRQAIMADNLVYCRSSFQDGVGSHNAETKSNETHVIRKLVPSRDHLVVACVFGSKNVAEFLMEKLKIDLLNKEQLINNENILNFVLASPNEKWAMEIAQKLLKSGILMPAQVAVMADNDRLQALNQIIKMAEPKDPGVAFEPKAEEASQPTDKGSPNKTKLKPSSDDGKGLSPIRPR